MSPPSSPPGTLESDAYALCVGVLQTVATQEQEENTEASRRDEVAAAINRHGFDPLIDHLTGIGVRGLKQVAACRGTTARAVLADYFTHVGDHQPPGLTREFRRWIRHGHRPRLDDPAHQELFVIYLLGLHFMTATELAAGKTPAGPPHRTPLTPPRQHRRDP